MVNLFMSESGYHNTLEARMTEYQPIDKVSIVDTRQLLFVAYAIDSHIAI